MRIPLATDLKTRTGAPDKDARLKNSYVEVKGDQAAVRKRPAVQGGISVITGVAQGGIGFYIGSTPYFIGFWGDTLVTYNGDGSNWNSGTIYPQGSMVSYGFANYWSVDDATPTPNVNNNPETTPSRWRTTPTSCVVPAIPAPVIIGTSQSYTESGTLPPDQTLSDVSMGYYCSGELRKKVVVSYTLGAGASTFKVYSNINEAGYGLTETDAANNWFDTYIPTQDKTCPGVAPYYVWLQSLDHISGGLVYYQMWTTNDGGVPNVLPCPGQLAGTSAAANIVTVTAYLLTATTTESYYLL